MKKTILYIVLTISTLQTGCIRKDNSKQNLIVEFDSTSRMYSVFKNIGNELQNIIITNKDTTIVTKNGVIITIPKNAFVDASGNIASEIHIRYKDMFNTGEFVANNIETSFQGNILESSGMFYINAKDENNNPLTLKKDITIDFPTSKFDPLMEIYQGSFDKNGTIVWNKKIDSGLLRTDLIILPLDYSKLSSIFKFTDTLNKLSMIKKSFISTYQFMYSIRGGLDSISSNIYAYGAINGLNLWQCDSLVIKHYSDEYFRRFGKKINIEAVEFNDILNYAIKPLNSYYKERLTKPKYIETFGIDLGRSDALEMLVKKGLDEKDASEAISNFKRAKSILLAQQQREVVFYSFKIHEIGYVNIDKLVFNDELIDAEIDISLSQDVIPECVEAFLIYNDKKISIKGVLKKPNKIDFSDGIHKKLPPGKANLIILGIRNECPYFVQKELNISKSIKLELTMKKSSFPEIAKKLKFN